MVELFGRNGHGETRFRLPDVECSGPGELVVDRKRLEAALRACTAETVTIAGAQGGAVVLTANGPGPAYSVQFPAVADVPAPLAELPDGGGVTVPAAELARLLRCTVFAVAHEVSRYSLDAVRLQAGDDTLTTAATDGRRLSLCSCAATTIL